MSVYSKLNACICDGSLLALAEGDKGSMPRLERAVDEAGDIKFRPLYTFSS